MKVIIAEKPSVAKEIAKILKITNRKDGYFEGNNYQVTWAIGHLVELIQPHEYNPEWKKWSIDVLPIFPEEFKLKNKKDTGLNKQLNTIKKLFKNADEIICATDAGREGELIFRYILSWCQCEHIPAKRLWIASLTTDAIKKGFLNLKSSTEYDSLYEEAKCRSESDWIVGLNCTRLFTIKYGRYPELLSIGRVQTPVLSMIVNRDHDIKSFKPNDFWELETIYRNTNFTSKLGRFENELEAERALNKIKGNYFKIKGIKKLQEKTNPPLLHDLTDLQKEMNRTAGFSAQKTLNLAQTLYEKKLLTYPRTDSRYLPQDMTNEIASLLSKLKDTHPSEIQKLYNIHQVDTSTLSSIVTGHRSFNDKKISDHYAIIPTEQFPGNGLSEDEMQVYKTIVLRFIANFFPPCVKNIVIVEGESNETGFHTKGVTIDSLGWKELFPEKDSDKLLPNFTLNESGEHDPLIKKGKTTPPKHFTESSLLSGMETAGKVCDDDEIKEALKEKGIGTPATRAAIIETLIKRKYIKRQKKSLLSTNAGQRLIGLIDNKNIKSASMTGEWEYKLKQIQSGDYSSEEFMNEIRNFITKMTQDVSSKAVSKETMANDGDDDLNLPCPVCKKGQVKESPKSFSCSEWRDGCKFTIWKVIAGKKLSFLTIKKLITKGSSDTLTGFTSKKGKKFSAKLIYTDGKVEFDFS